MPGVMLDREDESIILVLKDDLSGNMIDCSGSRRREKDLGSVPLEDLCKRRNSLRWDSAAGNYQHASNFKATQ